jgi:hypothetical protein
MHRRSLRKKLMHPTKVTETRSRIKRITSPQAICPHMLVPTVLYATWELKGSLPTRQGDRTCTNRLSALRRRRLNLCNTWNCTSGLALLYYTYVQASPMHF